MNESRVYIQRSDDNQLVEASLFDEASDEHLALWDSSWIPAMRAHRAQLPISDTPEDSHQDLNYFELTETQAENFRRNQIEP